MFVYKCPKCGATYSKSDVPRNEICSFCDTYLKLVNIKDDMRDDGKKEKLIEDTRLKVRFCSRCDERPYYEIRDDAKIPFFCPFCSAQMLERKMTVEELSGYKCMNSQIAELTKSMEESLSRESGLFARNEVTRENGLISRESQNVSVLRESIAEPDIVTQNTVLQGQFYKNYSSTERDYENDNYNYVTGVVRRTVVDNNYHRNFFQKLRDRIIYGQRTSDVCNTFLIERTENGRRTGDEIRVVIYGNIMGGIGSIFESSELIAHGKYIGASEFYARAISVDGSNRSLEYERGDIRLISIPIMIVLALILLVYLINFFGTSGIASLIGLFFILSGGAFLTLMFLLFRTRLGLALSIRGGFPFKTCLIFGVIIGAILTYLFRGII